MGDVQFDLSDDNGLGGCLLADRGTERSRAASSGMENGLVM
jgi:hypothetical protein